MINEDDIEYVEVTTFGGDITLIPSRDGLQIAQARTLADYLGGRITVEVFEAETGRLLRKEHDRSRRPGL